MLILTSQTRVVWEPQVQACLRLHSQGLVNHIVMLGTELFFLTLMTGGIYMHRSGRRALKIMYREVRGDHCSSGHAWTNLCVMTGSVMAYISRTDADCYGRK